MKKYKWGNITIFVIAILAISAVTSWYFFAQRGTKDEANKELNANKQAVLNKSDYKEESKQALRLIDKFLAQHDSWAVEEQERSESKQHGTKGLTRSMEIRLAEKDSLQSVIDKLKQFAEQNKLKIQMLKEGAASNGNKSTSLEVGLETAQGVFVTDKLLFIAATASKEKKQASTGSGRLALVIDDAGYALEPLEKMLKLDVPLTFAILPYRPYSSDSLRLIKNAGQQAILHLPMQPLNQAAQSEKTTITVDMSETEISDTTKAALDSLPGVIGVNNHQGSRATADERVMKSVLSVLRARDLFFVDSYTQPKTIAYKVAAQMGVPNARNMAFLDGEADVSYIKGRMLQAARAALSDGTHIAICHVRPATAIALVDTIEEIKAMGVKLVYVSDLVN